jgi:ketosteroid isomerase-like protein
MSERQDHVEAVRLLFERWAEGDFNQRLEFDEHAVFMNHPDLDARGPFIGPKAIADYTRSMLEVWSDFTIAAEEIVAAGDSVVARVHQRGTGRASGVQTELRYYIVWSFRGSKVIRFESFRERAEVDKAVGLSG